MDQVTQEKKNGVLSVMFGIMFGVIVMCLPVGVVLFFDWLGKKIKSSNIINENLRMGEHVIAITKKSGENGKTTAKKLDSRGGRKWKAWKA